MNYTLRPYQARAVAKCRDLLRSPNARVCLTCPTGGGKTIMALAISEGEDALWLVPSTALREQSPGRSVTVQALMGGHRPKCSLLIADECHHLAGSAEQWAAVARDYPRILGLTASPARHDGAGLGEQFDHMVVAAQYSELIQAGHLVDCRVIRPVEAPDEESGLAQHPEQAWIKHAAGQQGFAFFSRVALAEKFAGKIPRCRVVHGEQRQDQRADTMKAFRDGALDVLASVATLTEGIDCPTAAVCMLAVQPAHEGSYIQRVGRVLRPAPGKKSALLLDLPGASFRYGLPTDDREYTLDGKPIRLSDAEQVQQCEACGAVYHPAPACPVCGHVRPPKPPKVRVWGVPMAEITGEQAQQMTPKQRAILRWRERMAADPAKLKKWYRGKVAVGKSRGYKPGWAKYQFKQAMGRWPRREDA